MTVDIIGENVQYVIMNNTVQGLLVSRQSATALNAATVKPKCTAVSICCKQVILGLATEASTGERAQDMIVLTLTRVAETAVQLMRSTTASDVKFVTSISILHPLGAVALANTVYATVLNVTNANFAVLMSSTSGILAPALTIGQAKEMVNTGAFAGYLDVTK
jgi:hypothetical protein